MNHKDALEYGQKKLTPQAFFDILCLLSHITKKTHPQILAHSEQSLNQKQIQNFKTLIQKRLEKTPIEYLINKAQFFNLSLDVNEHVLIPRSETEQMTEYAMKILSQTHQKILDLGTGSGCIALALKQHCKNWEVHGSDLCEKALKMAKKNAQKHQLNIIWHQSDWFENIPKKTFDLIITNPPYIDQNDTQFFEHSLEPDKARFSPNQGLKDIQNIIEKAKPYLAKNGLIIIEHGFNQKKAIQTLFESIQFQDIQTYLDEQNHPRFTKAKK